MPRHERRGGGTTAGMAAVLAAALGILCPTALATISCPTGWAAGHTKCLRLASQNSTDLSLVVQACRGETATAELAVLSDESDWPAAADALSGAAPAIVGAVAIYGNVSTWADALPITDSILSTQARDELAANPGTHVRAFGE